MDVTGFLEPGAKRAVLGSEADIRRIIDPLPFYVLLIDGNHRIIMANEALYSTFGLRPEDVIGGYCPKVIHGVDGPYPGCPVEEARDHNCNVERDLYDSVNGTWMRSGAYLTNLVTPDDLPVFLHVVSDITDKKRADEELAALHAQLEETVAIRTRELEQANKELQREIAERVRAEQTIRRLAYFDGLTGLPNRANFSRLLQTALVSAHQHERKIALALLDIDGLKTVNDTMGHDAGDRLLTLVGERLRGTLRESDTAARMGGDEFVFIFTDVGGADVLRSIGQRLMAAFTEPFSVHGQDLEITASIGCSVYPDNGTDEVTLLKQADIAMYRAKSTGRNRFCEADDTPQEVDPGSVMLPG